jgi:alternate signal-mediated exported protein
MNKKLVKASLAGAAVVALFAAGGGTFAAWSDFAVAADQNVGAGELVLTLEGPNGVEAVQHASFGNFAPGEGKDVTRYLTSQQGDAVPTANLSVTLKNLSNADNGCSSASEAAEDPGCATQTTTGGEFGKYATVKIESGMPAVGESNCGHVTYTEKWNGTLNAARNTSIALGSLSNGDHMCMRATITLPHDAPNATQGDSSAFDWRFDLVQP